MIVVEDERGAHLIEERPLGDVDQPVMGLSEYPAIDLVENSERPLRDA